MSTVRGRSRLLEAAVVLTATRIAIAASPRRVTAALLRRASRADEEPGRGSPTVRARQVAEDVGRVAPLVHGSTCLSRALAGWLMLRWRGVPSVVRVGAQRPSSGVRMHAWLEVGGAPLIGQEEAAEFVALNR